MTNEVSGTVSVVDIAGSRVIDTIVMPEGSRPMGIAVTRDGKRVYVSNGRGGTVSVIDPATNTVTLTVEVGTRPWGIALSPDEQKLYTANGPANDVSVVNTATMALIRKIPAGSFPWGVAISGRP